MALLVLLALTLGVFATTALALSEADAPSFVWKNDVDEGDDEPGQKDLNAHSSATDSDGFWATFTWDVTGINGKNTADGCSLFDTDDPYNDLVDYALCVTAGGKTLEFQSLTLYQCSDGRDDRCTNPEIVSAGSTECFLGTEPDPFHSGELDTQSICVLQLSVLSTTQTPKLVNTCSYPSREPNSDPSDCVVKVSIQAGGITTPRGSTTWTATLEDIATVTPTGATGTVTFRLYPVADTTCAGTPTWTSSPVALVTAGDPLKTTADSANSVLASETGSNTISSGAGVVLQYRWTAQYIPSEGSDFVGFTSTCGELTTITPASVAGVSE